MALLKIRRTFILAVVGLGWLLAGCGASQAPTGGPSSQAASAVPVATFVPSPTPAADPASAPAAQTVRPRWILAHSVPDVVENSSVLFAIDADTGVSRTVCPLTGPFAAAPNGRWVACTNQYSGRELEVFDLAALPDSAPSSSQAFEPSTLPRLDVSVPKAVMRLDWSPDSRLLAVSTPDGLYTIEPEAGGLLNQIATCDHYACSDIAWSPDGQLLAFGRENGLFVLDQAGAERQVSAHGIIPRDEALYKSGEMLIVDRVGWSDDGQRISYATKSGVFEVAAFSDDAGQPPLAAAPPEAEDAPFKPILATSPDGGCLLEVRETMPFSLTVDPPEEPSDIHPAQYGLFVSLAANPAAVVQLGEIPFDSDAVWLGGEAGLPVLSAADPAMRGCAVLEAQSTLKQRGYDGGAIDGIYGPQTAEVARSFQRDNGLDIDGVVGPATWAILR